MEELTNPRLRGRRTSFGSEQIEDLRAQRNAELDVQEAQLTAREQQRTAQRERDSLKSGAYVWDTAVHIGGC